MRAGSILAVVVLLLAQLAPSAGAATPIVVVYDIEDKGAGLDEGLRDRLTDYLASSLAATGAYQVVPRSQLKQRLKRAKRESQKRCYDQSCQVEIGRELAAQKSLSTQLIKLGSLCMVTAVMYDLRKAASEGGARAEGGCEEAAVVQSIKQVIADLVPGKTPASPPAPPSPPATPPRPAGGAMVSVDIRSTPAGAEIFVDGRARGVTPRRFELGKGRSFELTLEKRGYAPVKQRLMVDGRLSRSFSLTLTAAGRAQLRTRTEWFGAEVLAGATFNSLDYRYDGANETYSAETQGIGGGLLTVVTLKWRRLFWSILEIALSGGKDIGPSFISTRLGYPLYLGSDGTHQLRFGLGVGGGTMGGRVGDGGVLLSPTAHYYYQGQRYFVGVGLRMVLPVVGDFEYTTHDGTNSTTESYYPVAVMLTVPMGWIARP